jgi:DNA uptake protein ComE-like DNA-binding protein
MTKVDLNTATQQELQSLRGIGPATARRIIHNRPYAATAELSRAEVAGPIIDLISPRVTVGPAPAPTTGR